LFFVAIKSIFNIIFPVLATKKNNVLLQVSKIYSDFVMLKKTCQWYVCFCFIS